MAANEARPHTSAEPHLRDYLRVIYARKWVLIGTAGAFVLAALAYVLLQTPIYRASVVLLIQPTQARVMDIKQVYDPTFGAEAGNQILRREFLETQYLLLLSHPNLEKTFNELGFDRMAEFQIKDPIRKFAKLFSVRGHRNSYLAEVSFEWKDRELATRTIGFLVEQYIRACRERALGVTEGGLEALRAKMEELRPKVEAKSQELQQFMASHNMVSLEQSQDIVVERLKEINRNLTQAETRRIQAESRCENIRAVLNKKDGFLDMPEVIDSQTVRDLKLEYVRMALHCRDLTDGLGPNHPEARAAQATLNAIAEKLQAEVHSVLSSAQAEVERAKKEEEDLRAALAEQTKAVMEFNKLAGEYRLLKDTHAALTRAYNAVVQRIEEIEIALAAGSKEDGVFVVAPAKVPTTPVRPRKARSLLIAMFLGIAGGVSLCLFLDYLDTSVKTKEEVEALLAAPVLGYVPALRNGEMPDEPRSDRPLDLMALEKPRSPIAEAFRSIRTALSFTRTGGPCQQLAITSALPSEGKTIVSVNIALAMAQAGRKVLLVDADLRRPRVHKVFGLESAPGLSNLLASEGEISLEQAIRPSGVENLSIITSGPVPPNPAELLGSARMADVAKQISERFDYVIYDTPPAVSVTDAAVLARFVNGLLLVVRSFSTERDVVSHAKEVLDAAGARLLGVVLNGADTPRGGYPYYGYYYYSRYYGEGDKRQGRRRRSSQTRTPPS